MDNFDLRKFLYDNILLREDLDITPEYVTTLLNDNGIDDDYFKSMGGMEIEGGEYPWLGVLNALIGREALTAEFTPEEDAKINSFISTMKDMGITFKKTNK